MTRQGQPASPGMYIVRVRSVSDGRTLDVVRGGTIL
jgi:hypothetical protein